ncbi:hypothetical protein ACSTJV_24200, partial [Vibrio parahaemolyticus]
VFTVDDTSTVGATPVVLGPIVNGLRVVSSGLDKTKRVVIEGIANPAVRPGVKVVPQNGEVKAASN